LQNNWHLNVNISNISSEKNTSLILLFCSYKIFLIIKKGQCKIWWLSINLGSVFLTNNNYFYLAILSIVVTWRLKTNEEKWKMLYFLSSDFFATCSSFCCCCSQCRIELAILIFILFITSLDRSADRIPFYYLTRGTDPFRFRFRFRFRFHRRAQFITIFSLKTYFPFSSPSFFTFYLTSLFVLKTLILLLLPLFNFCFLLRSLFFSFYEWTLKAGKAI
jgi:hypothetical protein